MSILNSNSINKSKDILDGILKDQRSIKNAIHQSENIFNPNEVTLGKVLNTTGNVTEREGYCLTNFIPVDKSLGAKITNKYTFNSAIYDISKNMVSGLFTEVDTIDLPEDAAYIRVSFLESQIPNQMIMYGESVSSTYIPYVSRSEVNLSKNFTDKINEGMEVQRNIKQFLQPSKNIFNPKAVTLNMSLYHTGELVELTDYCTTDYIALNREFGTTLSYKYSHRILVYDVNKRVIGGLRTENPIEITDEVKYIRVTFQTSQINSQQIEYGESVSPYYTPYNEGLNIFNNEQEKIANSISNIGKVELHNLFDKTKESVNKSISEAGQPINFSTGNLSPYIPVDRNIFPELKMIMRDSVSNRTSIGRSIFYQGDFTPIESSYQSVTNIEENIIIPKKAKYIRFSYNNHVNGYDIVLNYANQHVSWFCLGNPISKEADISKINFKNHIIQDYTLNKTSVIIPSIGSACTSLIPVKPNTRYYISEMPVVDGNWTLYSFNDKKESLEVNIYYRPYFKTHKDCHYLAFNLKKQNVVESREDSFKIIPSYEWGGELGRKVTENSDIIAHKTDRGVPVGGLMKILGVYENHIVYAFGATDIIYYSDKGWNSDFTEIVVADTFPDVLPTQILNQVVFFRTNDGIRSLLFFNNNQIYCSTSGAFEGFEIPNIWDNYGSKNWRVDDSDKDPTGERYRKHYPVDVASRQNQFLWHNGPVWFNGIGGQYSRGVAFANYTNAYTEKSNPSCLFYTEDGKNIYVQYEFGIYQKYYKEAGNEEVKTRVRHNTGDDVDASSLGSYTGGMQLKVRYSISPSEVEKDPTNIFSYKAPVDIISINGKNFTLSDASDVVVGDTVILSGTVSGDLSKILNNDASETIGGNNAFIVKSKTDNVITLADAIGNVNNNLMCRHIHGVNEFGDGIVIFTGEEYPESWFIYLRPYIGNAADGLNMNNAGWRTSVIRLNSSKNAHQRSLGVYLRSDGKMISIADSLNPVSGRIDVRGKTITMSNYGIHVFEISDIDDATKSISKYPALNAGYALYHIGGVLFYSDYMGVTLYSQDEGNTWKYICTDGTTKSILIGFDKDKRRFYFNEPRGSHFIFEVK